MRRLYLRAEGDRVRIKNPLRHADMRGVDDHQWFDCLYHYYNGYFVRLDNLHDAMMTPYEEDQRLSYWYKFDLERIGKNDYLLTLKQRNKESLKWETIENINPRFIIFLNQ